MKLLEKIGQSAIVALIIVNAVQVGFFYKIRRSAGIYESQMSFPLPSGYLMDRQYMAASNARCYLLRVSADGCPYCRADQHQYTNLVQQAQRAHCNAIILAPKTGEIKPNGNRDGVMQLQYIDMKLGQVLVPYTTPQTILLNGNGGVMWDQEGSMNDRALAQAVGTLRKIQ